MRTCSVKADIAQLPWSPVSLPVQAMAQEAKVLARQRAELEAQLAAERDNAQSHGYGPTPLATPKARQVADDAAELSEGYSTSSFEDDEAADAPESRTTTAAVAQAQAEVQQTISKAPKPSGPVKGKSKDKGARKQQEEEAAAEEVVSSESASESEDYQEDFEDDEIQEEVQTNTSKAQVRRKV